MFTEMSNYNAWCMKGCLADGVTTPAPAPTTPKTKSDCCNKLQLTTHGATATDLAGLDFEGIYDFAGTVNGRDYWKKGIGSQVPHCWFAILHGWRCHNTGFILGSTSGYVWGPKTNCPTDQFDSDDGWRHYNGSTFVDSLLRWECLGI